MAQLDRANVSFAALRMQEDLGFSDAVYGLGAGMFYIGYILLEIPGAVIAQRWSARLWVMRIMVTWGLLAAATAWVQTPAQFYGARFVLGLAEAGFFPAMMLILRRWFGPADRAKAIAIFMGSLAAAAIVGAPVSGWMLGLEWLGWEGWRWMFVLQGLPTVLLGALCYWLLPGRPAEARWLGCDEAALIDADCADADSGGHAGWGETFAALADKRIALLCAAYFCMQATVTGFSIWMPLTVKSLGGLSNWQTSLWAMVPPVFGLGAKLVAGWSSDRSGERFWHTVGLLAWGAAGMWAGTAFVASGMPLAALAAIFASAAGFLAAPPCFWAMLSQMFGGLRVAVAIGAVNMAGSIGSFCGPSIFGLLKEHAGHPAWSLAALGIFQAAAIACVGGLRKHS